MGVMYYGMDDLFGVFLLAVMWLSFLLSFREFLVFFGASIWFRFWLYIHGIQHSTGLIYSWSRSRPRSFSTFYSGLCSPSIVTEP